ncbi:hypothetical protein NA57DRAFT_74854 [Rhizodiscina lignyota]|uniref:CENP-V/GFA domain-containing protein n=1 Tax=Rhizodiscina lignyota TaxID=1504668 RepID=A0A9P4IGS3_9PEZI|nr:hypothetical protein NA57DRAFT_74854 [Rhizodiscina lignyota]
MPSGSCFCGETGVSYTGDVAMKALCHCNDCKKITGSVFSTNIVVPGEGFEVKGSPKSISKTADTGNEITSYFCGNCGTTLYRDGASFGTMKVIKAGVMDDADIINGTAKPDVELYAPLRTAWQPKLDGSADKQSMS